jgi:hypothetical protein
MSEEFQEPPVAEEAPATKAPRKRPAVRKSAKPKPENDAAPATTESPAVAREPEAAAPVVESRPADVVPEVIPFVVETAGGSELPGNPKKRRRRKKKHGQGAQQSQTHPHAVSPPAEAPVAAPEAPAPAMHAAPRPKLDPELVAKKAWKMFQAEVGEEGLALIDDHDAREISRRCFRLAEIFLEEAARRSR